MISARDVAIENGSGVEYEELGRWEDAEGINGIKLSKEKQKTGQWVD